MKNKEKYNNSRHNFLLSFFEDNGYEEKEVNDFWLIKQWNGHTQKWQVAIFTKESFKRYKEFGNKQKEFSIDWIMKEKLDQ